MSGCCGEPDCRRREPISLYLGDFSDTAYAVTRGRVVSAREDGTVTRAAMERHDVTRQLKEFIRRHPDWVRAQLEENQT